MLARVLIADDHGMLRDGLKAQLAYSGEFDVIAEASNGAEAVSLCVTHRPDVVIMDLGMPELNGIDATRQIREQCEGVKVLALSMHSEQRYVTEALKAGVSGYVLKDEVFAELELALKTVLGGGVYLSPNVQAVVVGQVLGTTTRSNGAVGAKQMTPREREVLQLIAEGLTAKQIASKLFLSVKTVETHRRQVMEKAGANSVADLVRYAIREGITTLDR